MTEIELDVCVFTVCDVVYFTFLSDHSEKKIHILLLLYLFMFFFLILIENKQ